MWLVIGEMYQEGGHVIQLGGQDANRQTLVSEDSKRTKAKPTRKNYSYGAVEGTRGRAVGAEIQEKG